MLAGEIGPLFAGMAKQSHADNFQTGQFRWREVLRSLHLQVGLPLQTAIMFCLRLFCADCQTFLRLPTPADVLPLPKPLLHIVSSFAQPFIFATYSNYFIRILSFDGCALSCLWEEHFFAERLGLCHTRARAGIAWLPKSSMLAVARGETGLAVHDLIARRVCLEWNDESGSLLCLCALPDGRVATGHTGGQIIVHDPRNPNSRYEMCLQDQCKYVVSLVALPDPEGESAEQKETQEKEAQRQRGHGKRMLLAGSYGYPDCTVRIWDCVSRSCLFQSEKDENRPFPIFPLDDGSVLALHEGKVMRHSLTTGTSSIRSANTFSKPAYTLLLPGNRIACPHAQGNVRIFSAESAFSKNSTKPRSPTSLLEHGLEEPVTLMDTYTHPLPLSESDQSEAGSCARSHPPLSFCVSGKQSVALLDAYTCRPLGHFNMPSGSDTLACVMTLADDLVVTCTEKSLSTGSEVSVWLVRDGRGTCLARRAQPDAAVAMRALPPTV